MAQSTRAISQPHYDSQVDQFAATIGATAIPMGTLCMNDGAGAVIPFLDSTYEAAAATKPMLGYAASNYTASDTGRFLFKRGTPWLAPAAKTGDVPTAARIGTNIFVQDNQTIKATDAGTSLAVRLLEIRSDGYLVLLP